MKSRNWMVLVPWVLLLVFAFELFRTAWITDDAAITLRTVMNFINGHGPVFNFGERVQSYTHPLWFFLISAATIVAKNIFVATFVLCFAASLGTLWMVSRFPLGSTHTNILAAGVLIFSKAFVDFSTSGLENPLSHILLIAVVLLGVRALNSLSPKNASDFFVSVAILSLNRSDLILLPLPLAFYTGWRLWREFGFKPALKSTLFAAAIVFAWTSFSVVYYGFPFPNTAYAKLHTGIPRYEIVVQGIVYHINSLTRDPITLTSIALAFVSAFWIGSTNEAWRKAVAAGVALYLAYIVYVGGDFMTGRFFTTPLLCAALLIATAKPTQKQFAVAAMVLAAAGIFSINQTLLSPKSFSDRTIPDNGIADERAFYFQQYGLITAPAGTFSQPAWEGSTEIMSATCGGLGYDSLKLGPKVHFVDYCALADALLARIPAQHDPKWRIGHYIRNIPAGYYETILTHENQISETSARDFYEHLSVIIRGELFTAKRFVEIFRMNMGFTPWPNPELYQYAQKLR